MSSPESGSKSSGKRAQGKACIEQQDLAAEYPQARVLPSHIDPYSKANQGTAFVGKISLKELSRLEQLLSCTEGEVQIMLTLQQEEGGRLYLSGQVITQLQLPCERCGNPVYYDINLKLRLSPVLTDSQAAQVPKEYDPLVTGSEPVSVLELVEEELLLSLPMVAKHEQDECPVKLPLAL